MDALTFFEQFAGSRFPKNLLKDVSTIVFSERVHTYENCFSTSLIMVNGIMSRVSSYNLGTPFDSIVYPEQGAGGKNILIRHITQKDDVSSWADFLSTFPNLVSVVYMLSQESDVKEFIKLLPPPVNHSRHIFVKGSDMANWLGSSIEHNQGMYEARQFSEFVESADFDRIIERYFELEDDEDTGHKVGFLTGISNMLGMRINSEKYNFKGDIDEYINYSGFLSVFESLSTRDKRISHVKEGHFLSDILCELIYEDLMKAFRRERDYLTGKISFEESKFTQTEARAMKKRSTTDLYEGHVLEMMQKLSSCLIVAAIKAATEHSVCPITGNKTSQTLVINPDFFKFGSTFREFGIEQKFVSTPLITFTNEEFYGS